MCSSEVSLLWALRPKQSAFKSCCARKRAGARAAREGEPVRNASQKENFRSICCEFGDDFCCCEKALRRGPRFVMVLRILFCFLF